MELQKQNTRAVVVVTESFKTLAKTKARSLGMPDIPMLVIPGQIGGISPEEVNIKVDVGIDALISALINPGISEKVEDLSNIVYPAEIIKVEVIDNDYFSPLYRRNWTDGLPVVPPTGQRVAAMLKGTGHRPEQVVAHLPLKGGVATVERIAINAVMAGCTPEYFPIVLAAVEAVSDPQNNMEGWAATTGSNSPMLIINGPVRNEMNINYGTNALGSGKRANAVIGRAVNLVIKNIGGVNPGSTDMTTIGAPWEYTMCLGENEDALPEKWEALNAERGFPDANTVTVKCINSQIDIFSHNALDLKQVLDTIAAGIVGINSLAVLQSQGVVIAFCPEVASLVHKDKWSKQAVKQYIFEKARQPLKNWQYLGDNWVARDLIPESKLESKESLIRMIPQPEDILIIVAGGAGKHSHWWAGGHGRAVTKSIDKWK